MKKGIFIIIMIVSIFTGCRQKKANEIEIGAIVPLTGYSAITGERFLKGLEMAVEDINREELPFSFLIKVEDSKSTGKDAHTAYRKLSGSGIKYFAAFGGQFIMGFAAETNNSDKILFASAAPNTNLLNLTNRCFRIYPTIDMLTEEVKNQIIQRGYRKIAVINAQNEAYSMCAESIIKKLMSLGIDVVMTESYEPTCQDFKNIVNKVANQDIDFIFSAGLGESSALLTKQLYSNPKTMNIPIIGDTNYSNSENLAIIGDIKSPIYVVDSPIDSSFVQRFYDKYGQYPNALSAYGYSVPCLIKDAVLELGVDCSADMVYEYIKNHHFDTVAGPIAFDSTTSEPILSLVTNSFLPKQ